MAKRPVDELACRILAQERAATTEALRGVLKAYSDPIPGTPRARDLAWLDGREHAEELGGLLNVAVHDAAQILHAAREHVLALEAVLSAGNMLPVPSMTLGRAVLESVLYVCWLADPNLAPAQRVARAAAMSLASAQGGHEALAAFPNPPDGEAERAHEGFNGMQRLFEQYGLTVSRRRGTDYAVSVGCDGESAPLRVNVTAESQRYAPGNHYLWVTGSGATHSRVWFTRGLEGPWADLVVMVVAPLLDVVDALIDNAFGYVGLDPAGVHAKTHLRRTALLTRPSPPPLRRPCRPRCGYR